MRGHARDFVELAGKVALVGEAGEQADFSEGQFLIEKIAAGGANAQAASVFADTFALEAAEDAGEVRRVNASFRAEIIES